MKTKDHAIEVDAREAAKGAVVLGRTAKQVVGNLPKQLEEPEVRTPREAERPPEAER